MLDCGGGALKGCVIDYFLLKYWYDRHKFATLQSYFIGVHSIMDENLNNSGSASSSGSQIPSKEIPTITIRFAGDSGDGMQLAGDRFANLSAVFGNDVLTFSDFPAEIRAPAGTVAGVSGYQLRLGESEIHTPGDQVDVLVVMNPACLKANLDKIRAGGLLIANSDAFTEKVCLKLGLSESPLTDGSLDRFQVVPVSIDDLTARAVEELGFTKGQSLKFRNFCALGLICWLLSRPTDTVFSWIEKKFAKKPEIIDANKKAFQAGFNYGDITDSFVETFAVKPVEKREKGTYRYINGSKALAYGLLAACEKSNLRLFMGGYPITPASDILHELSHHRNFPISVLQAEDEIAAIGAAIGASYAGSLGVTATSGPGLALKQEALNLAVITELPLVVINVQRGGPSTGLPTKTEQSDLLQTMYGRNGDSPVVVLAARSAGECFEVAYEACRIAVKYMTPVVVLSDGSIANGSEPWKIPDVSSYEDFDIPLPTQARGEFLPYKRREATGAREWASPGMEGFQHRIGGLEKDDLTGEVSYDPANHQKMTDQRHKKIETVSQEISKTEIYGNEKADILVLGWGSTYGAIKESVDGLNRDGHSVAGCHLRFINPLPADLSSVLSNYKKVLVPENNCGQLAMILRSKFGLHIESFSKVQGLPFQVEELKNKIRSKMEGKS